MSNKVLLEAGFGGYIGEWGGRPKQDPYTQDLARIVEQCTAGCPANGNIPGLSYRSQSNIGTSDAHNLNETFTWRASISYVTGGQSLKIGYIGNHLLAPTNSSEGPSDLPTGHQPRVPNQLTEYILNWTDPHAATRCLSRNGGR